MAQHSDGIRKVYFRMSRAERPRDGLCSQLVRGSHEIPSIPGALAPALLNSATSDGLRGLWEGPS